MEGFIFSEDLCRLCLWRSNKLLPIFSEEGEIQGIPLKIGTCLPISINRDDCLPKLICSQCIYKLEMFSEFRNSCVRSDQLLRRYSSHEHIHAPPASHISVQQIPLSVQQAPVSVQQMPISVQQMPVSAQQMPVQQQCNTMVMQQESMKLEVMEPDPIGVPQEVPFMCIIPEQAPDSTPSQAPETPYQMPIVTSVDTFVDTDIKINGIGVQQKEVRHSSAKRSRSRSEPHALRKMNLRDGPIKQTKGSKMSVVAKRNMHKCKHCSRIFPSRMQLSSHLTSSNCLFRYTCRYCGKVFGAASSRIQHEKNHLDKKNFVCRICKGKFQSSFDLHVHAVQGCEKISQNKKPEAKKKLQQTKQQGNIIINTLTNNKPEMKRNNGAKVNGITQVQGKVLQAAKPAQIKCKSCSRIFAHALPFKRHIINCRRSQVMYRYHEMRRKMKQMRSENIIHGTDEQVTKRQAAATSSTGTPVAKELVKRKMNRLVGPRTRGRQNASIEEDHIENSREISPKASLLAVLGLKEKPSPPELRHMTDETRNGRDSPEIIIDNEVVTVCDICRKIFTSEAGMLNHQSTAHNRKLTAEKIKTLMRVDI